MLAPFNTKFALVQAKRAKGEREKLQVTIQQLQLKNKNLRQELEDVEGQLEEAEASTVLKLVWCQA